MKDKKTQFSKKFYEKDRNRFMALDSIAVRNLELVKNNAENKKYGTLLWLLDKTKTAMGARLLNSLILSPLKDLEEINYRQRGVAELVNAHTEQHKDLPWWERKLAAIDHLRTAPRDVKLLILADKLSNIRSMAADHARIGDKLWERFCADKTKLL